MVKLRDIPQRDDYFMALACVAGAMCRSSKHASGAIVVPNHYGINQYGIGWDTMPGTHADQLQTWDDSACVYAEVVAALQLRQFNAAICYSNRIPPLHAITELVHMGVNKFVYLPVEVHGRAGLEGAKVMGCRIEEYRGNINWLRDHIRWMESSGVFGMLGR